MSAELLADTELLLGDDGAVAVDVLADEIIQKAATLTYECLESACGRIIFVICPKVFGQMSYTDRE